MPMELLGICIALAVLALLALRYGYDSRPGIQSKEEELAWFGMTWDAATLRLADLHRERAHAQLVELAASARPRRTIRRAAAQGLRTLALWLSPELATETALRQP
jgi:hypothetical protein